ncbi:MAG: PrsW family glutamic-type intramembrane protease [Cyanobacteria bacterium P01_A01_bin.84]
MAGKNARQNAILRLVSGTRVAAESEYRCLLLTDRDVVIGRDPNSQFALDAIKYKTVSRRHAVIRPLLNSADTENTWVICDLDSANGTYINEKRIDGCQRLRSGDRITLGHDGPQLIFEDQAQTFQAEATISGAIPTVYPSTSYQISSSTSDSVTLTKLFPIISTGKDLTRKAYLLPGILTVIFVVLMFATVGRPEANQVIVAIYIAFAAFYFIYRLCGKEKPWWIFLGCALATMLILRSPILPLFIYIFRDILPGNLPMDEEQITVTELLVRMFFGAGLMEELLKALPILGVYLIGRGLNSPWRERIGVWEPLDGILLGAASAVGFTLIETLGQYVPQITQSVELESGLGTGQLVGLQLLIPRILGSVAGHMAYSGYLGYFIGLAILKPSKSWQILSIGYLSASALHALWNATGALSTGALSAWLLVIVGVVSYAFLMAAILKARALSPTRSQNFATRFFDSK